MAAVPKRLQALAVAKKEIGVTEHPAGSNWGPRVSQFIQSTGFNFPMPWCMAFIHWCYKRVNVDLGGGPGVENFDNWADSKGYRVSRPLRGDIVCYDWDANNWDDHVGIVDRVLAVRWIGKKFVGWVRTVEGNTAFGNDSNGGKVMIRYRWIKDAKFVRIPG